MITRTPSYRLAALALLVSGIFIAVDLSRNPEGPLFPTDDSYIYLQYARRLADGEGLHYTPGNPLSTGATSLLFTLLLAVPALVCRSPESLTWAAIALACAANVLLLATAYRWMHGATGASRPAWFFVAALALCGPVAWGMHSGMEIPLSCLLLVLCLSLWEREGSTGRISLGLGLATAGLALARPEMMVSAGCLLAAAAWTWWRGPRDRRRLAALARVGLPALLAGCAYFAVNLVVGGSLSPQSASGKIIWEQFPPLRAVAASLFYLVDVVKGLLTGLYPSGAPAGLSGIKTALFCAPLTLPVALAGAWTGVARIRRTGRIDSSALAGGMVAAHLLVVAFSSASGFQNHRYLVPVMPLILFLVFRAAWGAEAETPARRRWVFPVLAAHQFLFLVPAFGLWVAAYAQESANLRTLAREVAPELRQLAEDRPVAILDAGAIPFFGGVKTVDLLGLTTPEFRGAASAGAGSIVESILHLPAERRPLLLASQAYPEGGAPADLNGLAPLTGPVIWRNAGLSFSRYEVRRVLRERLEKAPLPASSPDAGDPTDAVDVGWLASERAHGYSNSPSRPGVRFQCAVLLVPAGGRECLEGARYVEGAESFRLQRGSGGGRRILVGRIAFRGRVAVCMDGGDAVLEVDAAPDPPRIRSGDRWLPLRLEPDSAAGFWKVWGEVEASDGSGGESEITLGGNYLSTGFQLLRAR